MAAIPFRAKPAPNAPQHHHRSSTGTSQKSFKSKKATKGLLRQLSKGRVGKKLKAIGPRLAGRGITKASRKNTAEQYRKAKSQQLQKKLDPFTGPDAAPRTVALVPLCEGLDVASARAAIFQSIEDESCTGADSSSSVFYDKRTKQCVACLTAERNFLQLLDNCRLADYICFILSADVPVDDLGLSLIRAAEAQGIAGVKFVVQGLPSDAPSKVKHQIIRDLRSLISHFFPESDHVHILSSGNDCQKLVNGLCAQAPRPVHWRAERTWMLVEPVTVDVADDVDGLDTRATRPSILTGFVRGQPLSPDHLVQIGEHGPFRIERLEDVSLPLPLSRNQQESMQLDQATDRCSSVYYPTHLQENSGQQIPAMQDVLLESSPGPLRLPSLQIQSKGVQLDDHHYFSDDSAPDVRRAVKAPQGTSAYQAAWYLDDESAEEYDDEGPEGAHRSLEAEPLEIEMDNDPELGSLTADDQSLTFEQLSMEDPQLSLEEEQAQLLSYRDSRKNTAAEDREYPDEIELPASAKAREQLAKYRGLKNLRSSAWDHTADQEYQPEQWDGLWSTRDVRGSLRMAAQTDQTNCVLPGRRVRIHLKDVPAATQEMLRSESALPLFTLLPGEHRQAACNIQINLSSDCPRPIKSKEELILQCGPRRLAIQPLFSEGGRTPNDVHKFKRFLHPGQTAVATFMGLFHHGPIPCLLFLRDPETSKLQLIGTGTNLPPSSERVIAKRIVLTGHPYKIHKRLVTIRYMFFNPEDVMWFKALQLWTRRGRIGYIKESLGTHGYFKATFDGKLNPLDTVAISLYKRVWPRVARAWSSEDAAGVRISEVMDANAMHD